MTNDAKLLLVGCGKMGGALLQRVTTKEVVASATIIEPALVPEHLKTLLHVRWLSAPEQLEPDFKPDIIVFAIKPQQMASALPDYRHLKGSVYLSIAAGVTITKLESYLGDDRAIVRSMPNLPASIGQGMTVATANEHVSPTQRMLCDKILASVGEISWIDDEDLLDAVTALSGSGPAYVFALCEAMAEAGEALGLPEEMAEKLARETVIGSGALMSQSMVSAETLRMAVTSPGGTTEAALKHLLSQNDLQNLILKAMKAAAGRAGELSQ